MSIYEKGQKFVARFAWNKWPLNQNAEIHSKKDEKTQRKQKHKQKAKQTCQTET